MNLRDVSPAVTPAKTLVAVEDSAKCLTPFALLAAIDAKFLSNQERIARFIAAIVFPAKDRNLKNTLSGVFLISAGL